MSRWMPLASRSGKVGHMGAPAPDRRLLLREDLSKEYYAILDVVSSYDGWLLIVKGWSVTLSLAALGLGFQQRHFALFALAAVTGATFWYLDALMKGYQYRYYVRMREIEYTAFLINRVALGGEYRDRKISAPRIDMTWDFKGYGVRTGVDWRDQEPERRSPQKIHRDLRRRFWLTNVMLPHAIAFVLGLALFFAAWSKTAGLEQLHP